MKPTALFLILVAASLVLSGSAFAGTSPDNATSRFTSDQLSRIENNLLLCLASELPGVRATAALTLRQVRQAAPEYSFTRCIIPLMRIVKGEEFDITSRIAAGLALHDLASSRGDYAIKMTAQFTETERVKRTYEHLVFARSMEKATR
ncbi:MAG: hypothetical protein HRF44_06195 [Ignavibacterium sp.]|jgi:hypothetical protein